MILFFTKLNADKSYVWTKTWGSNLAAPGDSVDNIIIDSNDNIYLVGSFRVTVDFDPTEEVDEKTSVGGSDVYLTKYNSDDTYAWTKTWGGVNHDYVIYLEKNSNDDIYVVGSYQLTVDFDPTEGVNSITSAGIEDSYISKFGSDGTYDFTYTWGGPLMDEPYSVDFDSEGNWYVGGFFNGSIDFDPTNGVNNLVSSGSYDHFFSIFDENDNYLLTRTFGTPSETNWWDEILYDINIYNNNLYLSGSFVNTIDFDPSDGVDEYTSVGSQDVYLSKYNLIFLHSPIITTMEASDSERTSVNLNGEINSSEGEDANSRGFNYGLTLEYGETATETGGPFSPETFSINVENLSCDTTYHYRSFASNTIGTGYGDDATFTTADCASSSGSRARPKMVTATIPSVVTPNTIDVLSINKSICLLNLTLRQGSAGEQVKCLQNKLGIFSDGIFGPKTKAAVIIFQKNYFLAPDGIVGPITRGEINKN